MLRTFSANAPDTCENNGRQQDEQHHAASLGPTHYVGLIQIGLIVGPSRLGSLHVVVVVVE